MEKLHAADQVDQCNRSTITCFSSMRLPLILLVVPVNSCNFQSTDKTDHDPLNSFLPIFPMFTAERLIHVTLISSFKCLLTLRVCKGTAECKTDACLILQLETNLFLCFRFCSCVFPTTVTCKFTNPARSFFIPFKILDF